MARRKQQFELTPVTPQQVRSAMAVAISVIEVIREAREVPAGTIYAALMAQGIDLETYERMERCLLNTRLVEKRGDLLRWIGPEVAA